MPIYHDYFYSNCSTLDVGCRVMFSSGTPIWSDGEDASGVVGGKFSDGTYCYTVANGVITSKAACTLTVNIYGKLGGGSNITRVVYGVNDSSCPNVTASSLTGTSALVATFNVNSGDTVYINNDGNTSPYSPYAQCVQVSSYCAGYGCASPADSVLITADTDIYVQVNTNTAC